jgi:REP element-mobilizing transposase RayT
MRYWLLTSTFYGNWLPGDRRGFVGRVRDIRPGDDQTVRRREHDRIGDEYDRDMLHLEHKSRSMMKDDTIRVNLDQASALIEQFRETSVIRNWALLTVAVMRDHVHWVVGLDNDRHGQVGLQSLKAYGSRVLNKRWGRPLNGTWWTSKGSARALPDERAVADAFEYVAFRQPNPLRVWIARVLLEWMRHERMHGRLTSAAR